MGLFAHWVISPISWVTGVILVKRQWNCIFPFLYPTMIILTEIDLCCRENLVSAGQLQYYSSSVNPTYLYSLIVKFQTWMHIQLFCYCFFPNQLVFIGLFIFYLCHPESFRLFLISLLIHHCLLSFIMTARQSWMGTRIPLFYPHVFFLTFRHLFWGKIAYYGVHISQTENKLAVIWTKKLNNNGSSGNTHFIFIHFI